MCRAWRQLPAITKKFFQASRVLRKFSKDVEKSSQNRYNKISKKGATAKRL